MARGARTVDAGQVMLISAGMTGPLTPQPTMGTKAALSPSHVFH